MPPRPLTKVAVRLAAAAISMVCIALLVLPPADAGRTQVVTPPSPTRLGPGGSLDPLSPGVTLRLPLKGAVGEEMTPPPSPVPVYAAQPPDTYVVADYTFEGLVGPDPEGWTSIDMTEPVAGPFFHVDTVMVPVGGGIQAMWCGAHPDSTTEPFCEYLCLPGYGNSWSENLETPDGFGVTGDVTFSFVANWDTEPGYDYVYVEYLGTGSLWQNLDTIDGIGSNVPLSYNILAANHDGTIKFRIRFESDSGWSDEDCIYDTDGAIQLDNVTVSDGTGPIHFENFEGEAVGATETDDGVWVATSGATEGFGDYAGLFDTGDLHIDCVNGRSYAWGFFKDSPDTWGCNPGLRPVVPYGHDGLYLQNEIWSPAIDITQDIHGTPIPPTASKVQLEFSAYRDLYFYDNAVVYYIQIGSIIPGVICPSLDWVNPNWLFYGGNKEWTTHRLDIGGSIDPSADEIQIALGAWDAHSFCMGIPECDMCHTIAPMFDDVRVLRLDPKGLQWSAYPEDMFHDSFPSDGSTTGFVRMDTGREVQNPPVSVAPGDSAVVKVWDDVDSLMNEASTGTPAVYVHVRSSGGQFGPAVLGERTPYLS
ncbi:MAG: hypothetical protein JSW58_11380, partial [Candidatus Latescibacterota bacterium]